MGDGSFMCFGGYVNGSRVNEVIHCKHEGNGFNAKSICSEQGPSARASMSVGQNGKDVYLFGGQEDDNKKMNDLWCFDCDACSWSQIELENDASLPTPRSGHSTVVHGQKMYIFGGILELTKELNDLCVFDFATKKFSSNGCDDEEKERDNIDQSPDQLRAKDASPLKRTKTLGGP